MQTLLTLIAFMLFLSTSSTTFAQTKTFTYIGTRKCKTCHMTKKAGAAYKIWQKTKHARAYTVLASEKALVIGKKMGIENPQKSDKCLPCHVTAHGVDANRLGTSFSIEEGVGCEACHGPGSAYKSKKTMTGLAKGSIDKASVGLVLPAEKQCRKCHNKKSPTYKPFNFDERAKAIAHLRPKTGA